MAKKSLYANFKMTYLKQRKIAICNIFNLFQVISFYNILYPNFQLKQESKLKLSIHVNIDIGFNILKNLRPFANFKAQCTSWRWHHWKTFFDAAPWESAALIKLFSRSQTFASCHQGNQSVLIIMACNVKLNLATMQKHQELTFSGYPPTSDAPHTSMTLPFFLFSTLVSFWCIWWCHQ